MLGQETVITAPDGRSWRVRRRWVERPVPNLRERWRRSRKEIDGEDVFDGFLVLDGSEGFGAIGIAIGIAIVLLILFPLLGVALELVVLLLVLVYGIFARVVLRRPWIVDAVVVDDAEERVAFAVEGWRDSSAALHELRTAIAAAGPPERLSRARRLGA